MPGWVVGCWAHPHVVQPISWVAGWMAGWLPAWLAGWLAGWLAAWLAGWLAGWVAGWLAGWPGLAQSAPPENVTETVIVDFFGELIGPTTCICISAGPSL